MEKATYVLQTKFKSGSKVYHKTDPERIFLVIGFCIISLDEAGVVTGYTVGCAHSDGQFSYFTPNELELATVYDKGGK